VGWSVFTGRIILCQIFDFTEMYLIKSSWVYFFHWSEFAEVTFCQNFPVGFAGQDMLNKDSTVWLDRARPANTCIPPSFPGNVVMYLPQKYICKYLKISKIFVK
jgi:hypothetical protein